MKGIYCTIQLGYICPHSERCISVCVKGLFTLLKLRYIVMVVNKVLTSTEVLTFCVALLNVLTLYQRFPQEVDMFSRKIGNTEIVRSNSVHPLLVSLNPLKYFWTRFVIFCLASCAHALNALNCTLRPCMRGAFLFSCTEKLFALNKIMSIMKVFTMVQKKQNQP